MRTFNRSAIQLGLTALFSLSALAISGTASATAFDGGIPATWDCTGDCGTLGANGDITASPEGGDYGYIVSDTGITGLGLGIPGETDGTRLRTGAFSAGAGDALDFYFNFVSPDGTSSFPDYAWVRLLDASLSEVAILFTARTTTSGDTVPGFGLPGLAPGVTLSPASTPIIPGAPTWSPLGGYSGACFGPGCGYTGWIQMDYVIASAGDYVLEFGVSDFGDQIWDVGLAFDGITVAGVPIDDNTVPEPATLALMGLGLLGLAASRRKAV